MTVAEMKRAAAARARHRRRVVAVIGSGVTADSSSGDIGRLIASLGCDLLTGAGRGAMEAVSRGFYETSPRRGLVLGVVPADVLPLEAIEARRAVQVEYEIRDGYPNPWVELAIYTHLPDSGPEGTLRSSRNHINVLSADAIVALPGGPGTDAEAWLALQYGVPIIAFGEHRGGAPHGIQEAHTLADVRAFLEHVLAA